MMIQVVKYAPNYIEVDQDKLLQQIVECVTNYDDIYFSWKLVDEVEWISDIAHQDNFRYFTIKHNTMHQSLLIAHYSDNKFYVEAYLDIIDEEYNKRQWEKL